MNIYIYGNQSFKKEVHRTLDHANIKFKIGTSGAIKDITSLDELKEAIQNNPDDIYLIDDEKIIKNNSINKKIKFLSPKDGISEEFLKENNIPEVSINSFDELPKYILRKYTEVKAIDNEIQQSIIGIVDKAYEDDIDENVGEELSMLISDDKESEKIYKTETNTFLDTEDDGLVEESPLNELYEIPENSFIQPLEMDEIDDMLENIEIKESNEDLTNSTITSEDFLENVGLNNVSYDYDHHKSDEKIDEDFLNELETIEISNDIDSSIENNEVQFNGNIDDFLKDLESIEEHRHEELSQTNEDKFDEEIEEVLDNNDVNFEENIDVENLQIDDLEENLIEESLIEESLIGDNIMGDQFSQLDALSESDILDALENVTPTQSTIEKEVKKDLEISNKQNINLSLDNLNSQNLMDLITQLLNNKTLEITIKIKD